MHKSCRGFFLISFLIYTSASTIMIALLIRAIATWYPQLRNCNKRTNAYLKLSTALDSIVHDLHCAPSDESAWDVMRRDEIGWTSSAKSLGWRFTKNRLARLQGSYDENKKRWRKKAKSIAADSLSDCRFEIKNSEGRIIAVTVVLTMTEGEKMVQSERTVSLRTGVLYEARG